MAEVAGGMTEVQRAAEAGDVERLKEALGMHPEQLSTHARLNRFCPLDDKGSSPLHLAAAHGHEGCVRVLLAAGANTEAINGLSCTALCKAAQAGSEACLAALLAAGANTEAINCWGCTALHKAAQAGSEACLAALLKARAKKEAADDDGGTALHLAAGAGSEACLAALLAAGANKEAADSKGRTALHEAAGQAARRAWQRCWLRGPTKRQPTPRAAQHCMRQRSGAGCQPSACWCSAGPAWLLLMPITVHHAAWRRHAAGMKQPSCCSSWNRSKAATDSPVPP